MTAPPDSLLTTPLDALHRRLGARMVPFAGYAMPVHYAGGIIAEHRHTRALAGLFDVSHMGQIRITGPDPAAALERLVPVDVIGLAPGRQRYGLFTNDTGGILDDLMIVKADPLGGDALFLVVNAACKHADFALLDHGLPDHRVALLEDRALLALQGPAAITVLTRQAPQLAAWSFMQGGTARLYDIPVFLTRSGYTGEDGFEISVAANQALALADALLAEPEIAPIGLGARDSLRLEAGLCLYGHDITATTSPVEAALAWAIGKRRRAEGGFPGAAIIQAQLAGGAPRRRVGLKLTGKAPAREGTEIQRDGRVVGVVTSGGYAPSLDAPIAMGYVEPACAALGTGLDLIVRGKPLAAMVTAMPFVPHRYVR